MLVVPTLSGLMYTSVQKQVVMSTLWLECNTNLRIAVAIGIRLWKWATRIWPSDLTSRIQNRGSSLECALNGSSHEDH